MFRKLSEIFWSIYCIKFTTNGNMDYRIIKQHKRIFFKNVNKVWKKIWDDLEKDFRRSSQCKYRLRTKHLLKRVRKVDLSLVQNCLYGWSKSYVHVLVKYFLASVNFSWFCFYLCTPMNDSDIVNVGLMNLSTCLL